MDEILEAKIFSQELDRLLAGEPASADVSPDLAGDLAFAARLARLGGSSESRIKASLKEGLAAAPRPLPSFGRRVWAGLARRPALSAAGACLVAVLAVPILFEDRLLEFYGNGSNFSHGAFSDGGVFGSGASPYEPGVTGLAPGGMSGGGIRGVARRAGYGGNSGSLEALKSKPYAQTDSHWNSAIAAGTAAPSTYRKLGAVSGGAGESFEYLRQASEELDRDGHDPIVENSWIRAAEEPLSTFSIDVDAASYAQVRRQLNEGRMPVPSAVRLEEMINYFKYDYPEPSGEHPFSVTADQTACPWNDAHRLVRIGLKSKALATKDLPPNNLVFLIDTSGSMMGDDRLPLVKAGLKLLVAQLRPQDRIAIVTYAGSAGLALPSTSGRDKATILDALDRLEAGGSTAGGAGIALAYKVALDNFLKKGNNRVILATDGDFNVGVSSDGELVRMIEKKREDDVFLTVLGVGQGNLQDGKMMKLADKGNGNYAFLDDIFEAQRVLVKEMGATLLTVAKDVKIQVEFNPGRVQAYKLLGYEKRLLAKQDFNDDKKDAGELGAGHTVTALYEVVPAGVEDETLPPAVDALKYAKAAPAPASESAELLTVKLRYKKPTGDVSKLLSRPLDDRPLKWSEAPADLRFAAAVAGFGMTLRGSETRGSLDYDKVRAMAAGALGKDEDGYRAELVRLVEKAKVLDAVKK